MSNPPLTLDPSTTLIAIAFVWLIILSALYIRSQQRFRNLTKGISKKDLRTLLEQIKKDNKLTNNQITAVNKVLSQTKEDLKVHFQSIGFIRYNPFSDTGGDQSFCLSVLNRHGDGFVLSSLHSRDQTRTYAKKIKAGKSPGYTLSKEERAVIKEALKA